MDIDIMSRQLADLLRRMTALEGGAQPEVISPEGVPQLPMTEERVKELIAEYEHDVASREANQMAPTIPTGSNNVLPPSRG